MRYKLIFSLFLLHLTSIYGQTIKSAYAYGEEDSKSNILCQFSNKSAISAMESALRYNRVNIVRSSEKSGIIKFYTAITNWEVDKSNCSVNMHLDVHDYKAIQLPGSNKLIYSKVIFCERSVTGFLGKLEMQTNINAKIKESVDECLSDIEKNAIGN
jgi:hypothetical protein